MTGDTKRAYSVPEAAEACGVDQSRIYRAIRAGHLRAKLSGTKPTGEGAGKYLIRADALDAWLDGLADA